MVFLYQRIVFSCSFFSEFFQKLVKKIIPEGIFEAEFGEFIQHFVAEKISVYESVTQEQEKMETDLASSFAL
tara:strand:- start:1013 stop:1228 length:216 start_codon:yes stop_codon:yes gene_type:complete